MVCSPLPQPILISNRREQTKRDMPKFRCLASFGKLRFQIKLRPSIGSQPIGRHKLTIISMAGALISIPIVPFATIPRKTSNILSLIALQQSNSGKKSEETIMGLPSQIKMNLMQQIGPFFGRTMLGSPTSSFSLGATSCPTAYGTFD